MSAGSAPGAVGEAVGAVVEGLFATVSTVHDAALEPAARPGFTTGAPVLDLDVPRLLLEPGQLAVGLGLVVAPREGRPLRLEWWQVDPGTPTVRALEPDLRPTSLGYYDYTATEWFDVPRRTGRRHVVGPYVDVHGTGRYLLTLTEPVLVDGEFVGVAGVDVSLRRFEAHVLHALGGGPEPFVLLNDEDRVVLSTASRWLVGERIEPDDVPGEGAGAGARAAVTQVAGTPWRLLTGTGRCSLRT